MKSPVSKVFHKFCERVRYILFDNGKSLIHIHWRNCTSSAAFYELSYLIMVDLIAARNFTLQKFIQRVHYDNCNLSWCLRNVPSRFFLDRAPSPPLHVNIIILHIDIFSCMLTLFILHVEGKNMPPHINRWYDKLW